MKLLGVEEAVLKARNGFLTASEIAQQPSTVRATADLMRTQKEAIEHFLAPLLARPDLRVILSGAGTSAFIGQCLAPWLARRLPCGVEAIATTDITSAPHLYFDPTRPTLLVSFARSGQSPESLATVDYAEQLVGECHHLAITCNADGQLAQRMKSVASGRILQLPDETHDRGFAMTSSFTSMAFAAVGVLGGISQAVETSERIAASLEHILTAVQPRLAGIAEEGFLRVVFLGSHILKGAACEAALKLLELTDGRVIALHDTPLGFRHGPKTVVNDRTLIVVFLTNGDHSRRYDLDLAKELVSDGRAGAILLVDAAPSNEVAGARTISLAGLSDSDDMELLFAHIVVAQIFAFHSSLVHGLSPDSPNRSGTVNRVVQGVRIHAVA